MIPGYLKIIVLNELNRGEHTGYEMMKKLEQYLGKKPSAGSIYPLLNDLLRDKLVSLHKEGRRKHYEITEDGKEFVKEIMEEKKEVMFHHLNLLNKIGCTETNKRTGNLRKTFDLLQSKEHLFMRNIDYITDLKDILIDIVLAEDSQKKEPKLRAVLKDTIKKLRRIKSLK